MNGIIMYFLLVKKNINNFYNWMGRIFGDTRGVYIIFNNSSSPQSFYCRFMMIKFLINVSDFFLTLKRSIDKDVSKMKIRKHYINGSDNIIMATHGLKLSDAVTYSATHHTKQDSISRCIFLKFDLVHPNGSIECLKQLLIDYKDPQGHHQHSLENIMLFENRTIEPNCDLNIVRFNKGLRKTYKLRYDAVAKQHLNFFYDME